MKSIYENTGKGYTQQGNYVLPNVEIEDKAEYKIGVWDSVIANIYNKIIECFTTIISLRERSTNTSAKWKHKLKIYSQAL